MSPVHVLVGQAEPGLGVVAERPLVDAGPGAFGEVAGEHRVEGAGDRLVVGGDDLAEHGLAVLPLQAPRAGLLGGGAAGQGHRGVVDGPDGERVLVLFVHDVEDLSGEVPAGRAEPADGEHEEHAERDDERGQPPALARRCVGLGDGLHVGPRRSRGGWPLDLSRRMPLPARPCV